MTAKKRRNLILILLLVVATVLAVKMGRHYVFARRFAEVEPGQLYRSGYLEAIPLRRTIRNCRLKTILALLNDEPDTRWQQQEEKICREEGVRLIRIPMPGNGKGDFDAMDRAAEVLADPANRPLLVHCAAGVHRTGASYFAYRTKYCGWSLDQALAEGGRYGYPLDGKPELVEHLRQYYAERVASPAPTSSSQPEPQRD